MADAGTVLARLQAALSVYDPSWDISAGSATYKILEAVAQEISVANNNSTLQTYSYDVNTKSGSELDVFCNLFGVYRQLGKRSSGTVTFSTTGNSVAITVIPVGTQVAIPIGGNNGNSSAIYYATTAAAVIPPSSLTVDVPVSAVLPGVYGNAPASTISQLVGSVMNVTGVTNNGPVTGGTDPENDAEFRNRWQNTAFNNTTGTYGKYVVTALQNQNVTRANAVGQQNYWDEQCQITATLSGGTTNNVTLLLVAYSGMTNLLTNSGITSTTVITSSSFTALSTGSTVASGINSMLAAYAPGYSITASASSGSNTIATGFNLSFSSPLPYRLMLGSGTNIPGTSVIVSGVISISGTSYWEWIQSANPDIGTSGTMSYINAQVSGVPGFLFPEGNELIGSNLNTSAQTVYVNTSDYYYPNGQPTIPLTINIANKSGYPSLFAGNTVEMISEYCPASSRALTLASGNYIDVFIDGTTANTATEQISLDLSNLVLSSGNATGYLNTTNYVFANGLTASSGTVNANGDYYIWLNQQPLVNFPSQTSIATSGTADSFTLYNSTNGTTITVPITLNKYSYITFTGTVTSGYTYAGTNFIPVNNANLFLYPGLALASGVATSGNNYYITSVTSSGIYLNYNLTGTYTTTTSITMSGKSLAYPIYDITDLNGSVSSLTALALCAGSAPTGWQSLPAVGNSAYAVYSHGYNLDVNDVDALVQQSRPVGTNVMIHQANFINMIVNLTLVISTGYSQSTVQSNINTAIAQYFEQFGYNQAVSFASIASVVISTGGVVNVRVNSVNITSIDGTIQSTRTSDFVLASNQLPSLYGVTYTYKGATNF
jgi:uncharacterized phage protein gp47/JayE